MRFHPFLNADNKLDCAKVWKNKSISKVEINYFIKSPYIRVKACNTYVF